MLDIKILYILLRDKNPDALSVLMNKNCFKYRNPMILAESEYVIEGRLESGLGLISNNELQTREKLVDSNDDTQKRLLFRARFYDRVNLK